MAITVSTSDPRGVALQATVTAQQALVTAAVAGSAQAVNAAFALKYAQDALVIYLIDTGRLQSSNILASSL